MNSYYKPFKLERYFAKYEFSVKYLLCASDCEALEMSELIANADDECKQMWNSLKLLYTESQGHPLLRQEIITAMYPSLSKDQVLVVVPEEGIYLSMKSILKPKDHVVSIYPAYQSLYEIASSLDCQVSEWKMPFSIQELKKLIRKETKLLVINFPHNPTGFIPTQQEFQEIIQICKEHNIYLFSDEMYRYLEYSPQDTLPPACEVYDKAITLSGMSKTFSLPGIRIGWIATNDEEKYNQIATMKDYTTICPPAPSELLALMALRQRQSIIKRNLEIIHAGSQAVEHFFSYFPNEFEFVPPKAGPIGFVKLKNDVNATIFCDELLKQTGILLLPGEMYDDKYVQYFRISFGRKNIPEIINVWKKHRNILN